MKTFKTQDGGRPPYWKMLEMLLLAHQWTNLYETWVVASHRVYDFAAMMRLPW